jgi:hypothetical protein
MSFSDNVQWLKYAINVKQIKTSQADYVLIKRSSMETIKQQSDIHK